MSKSDTNVPEWLREHVEPFRQWREARRADPGPRPPEELGRDFTRVEDVFTWLSHPSNWFQSELDIIRWKGATPSISESQAWQLAPGCWGRESMMTVVFTEQKRKRHGRSLDFQDQDEPGETDPR